MKRSWPIVLCLAAVSVSCSGGASASGPLGKATDPGTLCARPDNNGVATHGFLALRNSSSKPVTLRTVKLLKPRGLSLRSSSVTAIKNNTLVGVMPGVVKVSAAPLSHAIVPAHADRNLLLQLELSDKHRAGSTGDVEVRYTAGGNDYRYLSRLDVVLTPAGTSCPRS